MEPVSMSTLYNSNGKINWFGWIIFLGTLFIIGYNAYQWYINSKKIKRDEAMQEKKIMELEMNLREVRGNQYKSIDNKNQTNSNG